MTARIPKRISTVLVNALSSGVVPRVGLEYITVGRRYEIEALLRDLENTAEGGGAFRLITGRYGSGKSFLLQTIRNYAMDRGFVVADADLSPERRLTGAKGQGLSTYRELVTHLATRTRPDGGALELMLQKWISSLREEAVAAHLDAGEDALAHLVEEAILSATSKLEALVHGFDFALVLAAYWRACRLCDDEERQAALRWLRGEFATKTEARAALGVSAIITDDDWYDYMKLWAEFVVKIGYKGLVLFIDEGVNLYKISNSVSRTANYEKLLSMFNDTMQGKSPHMAILLGGTPQFVEDERRGLYSYEALRSRLMDGHFSREGARNLAAPVIKLSMLSNEEILLLLQKLRELHSAHYGYESPVTDEQLVDFMKNAVGRMGADTLLTPREIVRDFMDVQDILYQNPDTAFAALMQGHHVEAAKEDPDEISSFLTEFEL